MSKIEQLFKNNQEWAESILKEDPLFFKNLSKQQNPEYLWIGCSDSRVPANQIINLPPGEVFVHRNIANLVIQNDLNCQSVIQFAVEVLKVKHIIICGHYGCGGIQAAMKKTDLGQIENWLENIREIIRNHAAALSQLTDDGKFERLCELNVIEQLSNVCDTDTLQKAWGRGQEITVHGWIYNIENGILKDLDSRKK